MFDRVTRLDTVSSTNDVAATLPEGSVVVADAQTAGRGRRGRTWFSPAGSGLYASVVLAPARASDPVRATSLLTIASGVGVAEGLAQAVGLEVHLKWPNDLYVGARKLGGILAEAATAGGAVERVVVGFGINVCRTAYPADVAARATSIESELPGRPIDRELVLQAALAALARRYDDLLSARFDDILLAWRSRAPSATGTCVTWASGAGAVDGTTAGIDEHGALLLRVGDRTERIVAGELVWK